MVARSWITRWRILESVNKTKKCYNCQEMKNDVNPFGYEGFPTYELCRPCSYSYLEFCLQNEFNIKKEKK